jgi:CDP-diacylglycerol--serine O-phosphatidyltransferase
VKPPLEPLGLPRQPAGPAGADPAGERRGKLPGRLRRGAYLLPSLFTMGNMLLGFYAVVVGLRSAGLPIPGEDDPLPRFGLAAFLIMAAAFLDALDGRIARLTGTESEFGREYDSLADVLTFGMAPALLAYLWGVKDVAPQLWILPAFFMVCVATRLARFNVQSRVVDSRFFVGLPAPAGAGAICSLLFFAPNALPPLATADPASFEPWRPVLQWSVAAALLVLGFLMVSTFRYPSFKKIDLRKRWSYRAFIVIAGIVLVVVYLPKAFFLLVALVYSAWGPATYLAGKLRRRSPEELPPPEGLPS